MKTTNGCFAGLVMAFGCMGLACSSSSKDTTPVAPTPDSAIAASPDTAPVAPVTLFSDDFDSGFEINWTVSDPVLGPVTNAVDGTNNIATLDANSTKDSRIAANLTGAKFKDTDITLSARVRIERAPAATKTVRLTVRQAATTENKFYALVLTINLAGAISKVSIMKKVDDGTGNYGGSKPPGRSRGDRRCHQQVVAGRLARPRPAQGNRAIFHGHDWIEALGHLVRGHGDFRLLEGEWPGARRDVSRMLWALHEALSRRMPAHARRLSAAVPRRARFHNASHAPPRPRQWGRNRRTESAVTFSPHLNHRWRRDPSNRQVRAAAVRGDGGFLDGGGQSGNRRGHPGCWRSPTGGRQSGLGAVHLWSNPPPRGVPKIAVRFRVERNGALVILAEDQEHRGPLKVTQVAQ
jgi:hypothetical protein